MKRVLVVEDNRLERNLIYNIITNNLRDELLIDLVEDGETALNYLSKKPYDLLITDLIMPKVEGIELIRMVQANYKRCHIIAISGGNPFYLNFAKKLGVDGIFTKPLNKTDFLNTIAHLLKSSTSDPINLSVNSK